MSCLRCDGLHSLDEADQELYDAGGVKPHLNIKLHLEGFKLPLFKFQFSHWTSGLAPGFLLVHAE